MKSTPSHTPAHKKKAKRCSNNESTGSTRSEAVQPSGRPVRTAAAKAKLDLKEAPLGTKMRHEVTVKEERLSVETTSRKKGNKKKSKENNPNTINVKMEKVSFEAQIKKSKERSSDPQNRSASIIEVPLAEEVVVVLSDDDEENNELLLMPPPPQPASRIINYKNQSTASGASTATSTSETTSAVIIRSTRSKRKGVPPPIVEIKTEKIPDATLESIYEDAIDVATSLPGKPVDSTFIQPARPNEAKFVVNPQSSGIIMAIQPSMAANATFISQNETFSSREPYKKATQILKRTSTEYDFDDALPLIVQTKKPANELIHHTKKNVEVIEVQSPPHTRQTRTKTRANAASVNESGPSCSTENGSNTKFITPNLADMRNNAKGSQTAPKATSQTGSKLAHLNRAASACKIPQRSRDSSAEDKKSPNGNKWRKRDEKIKLVSQQREALEKERKDKLLKQMQEKEDKVRQDLEKKRLAKEKKDREAETRKNQEAYRNLKQQERKQKEEANREQMDNIRIATEKKALQKGLKQNNVSAAKKKPASSKYTFDMINTDDETDDESRSKLGRPTPPEWSLRGNREERIASQAYISSACIDGLFPVRAMTMNLQEIFPEINVKHLRRNSSAVWKTPPRYSTMQIPKYDA